jgi:hypothetical protein
LIAPVLIRLHNARLVRTCTNVNCCCLPPALIPELAGFLRMKQAVTRLKLALLRGSPPTVVTPAFRAQPRSAAHPRLLLSGWSGWSPSAWRRSC